MALESHSNIILIPDPSSPMHLVRMKDVTDLIAGLKKEPVRLVAASIQTGSFDATDLEFTYTAQGPVDIDGEEVEEDDRILFTGQSSSSVENLLYKCTHKGVAGTDSTVLAVADDFKTDIQPGMTVSVTEGDDHANSTWRLTTQGVITAGQTALTWEPFKPARGTEIRTVDFTPADGTALSPAGMEWHVEHNLGTDAVTVQFRNTANNAVVLAEWEVEDNDTILVRFADEPTSGSFRATIVG